MINTVDNPMQPPALFSFRRCPYAMRARMAIVFSGQTVEVREILLSDKPQEMLAISPKGTVPVLQLGGGSVIDESLKIMKWALSINDPLSLMRTDILTEGLELIEVNDHQFKTSLDQYKYVSRFPEKSEQAYRVDCEGFLEQLEFRLRGKRYLCSEQPSLADVAIFPFIRQFSGVDKKWFESSRFKSVRTWLEGWLKNEAFKRIMVKYPLWNENKQTITLLK